MSSAVDGYVQAMRDRGLESTTIKRATYHLQLILQLERLGAKPIRVLTPSLAPKLYAALQAGRAVDTHRNGLAAAKALGAWCVEAGWLAANPFAAVKGVGRRRRGKPQPTIDEARRLLDYCVANPTQESIATACYLLLGVRATELVSRDVRHVDDGGRRLDVTKSKTQAGIRMLEIPEVLQPLLEQLVAGRAGAAPLFVDGDKERRDRTWAWRAVATTTKAAGLDRFSPHGLRGTHATTARVVHATPELVAGALGHSSTGVQDRHYVDPAELAAAQQRSAWRVLSGGRRP